MRRGYIFLEILMGVALTGLVFVGAVAMFGDVHSQLQQRQLEVAARHLMTDCRIAQQHNMFVVASDKIDGHTIVNSISIFPGYDEEYYSIGKDISLDSKQYYFQDMGCKGVYFGGICDVIRFSALGSVNNSAHIVLKHRDNDELKLTLNLQPVTGRIEIESN